MTAVLETPALFGDDEGGKADVDDPAIWVNKADPARSRVIVTAKNAGLRVYDLAGHEVQAIAAPPAPGPDDAVGRFNNVDIVTGFPLGGKLVDLAIVTDRGRDILRAYRIDPAAGLLLEVTAASAPFAFNATQDEVNEQATAYGLATWRAWDGNFYAVATRRHTSQIGLFRLVARGGTVTYERMQTLDFPSTFTLPNGSSWTPCDEPGIGPQLEGLTIDPLTGTLYAAQEDVALWRVQLSPGRFSGTPRVVERVREFGIPATFDPETEECTVDYANDPGFGGRIAADVEGLTIYKSILLVSSQGDDTYYTYSRFTNRPLAHFEIGDGVVDGVQECDGATTTSVPVPGFPNGLLVVHDGHNFPEEETRESTNVKYLDAGFLTQL